MIDSSFFHTHKSGIMRNSASVQAAFLYVRLYKVINR